MKTAALWVRWLSGRDLPAVLGIERETFGDWTDFDFRDVLRSRNHIGFVAECDSPVVGRTVVGFMVYELDGCLMRVLNFAALTPEARRELLGKLRVKAWAAQRAIVWEC